MPSFQTLVTTPRRSCSSRLPPLSTRLDVRRARRQLRSSRRSDLPAENLRGPRPARSVGGKRHVPHLRQTQHLVPPPARLVLPTSRTTHVLDRAKVQHRMRLRIRVAPQSSCAGAALSVLADRVQCCNIRGA